MLSCMSRFGVVAAVVVALSTASAAEGGTTRRVTVSSTGLYSYALDENAPARKHEPRLPLCKGNRLRVRLPAAARRVVVNVGRMNDDGFSGGALVRVRRDDRRQVWAFRLPSYLEGANVIRVFVDGGKAQGTYSTGAVARCD